MPHAPHAVDAVVIRRDIPGVARLILNRPAQRNALSRGMLAALKTALAEIAADSSVRAVILAAEGPVFCSGHDLKEMKAAADPDFYDALFVECAEVMTAVVRLPQPVIARIQGVATAAGLQLVASCDLAVTVDAARFATPGVNIGLFCSTPMVALSRAIGRKQAMEMLLTGEMIDAETALRFGLVNRVVAADQLDATVDALAAQIAGKSGQALRIGKEAFYRQIEMGLDDAYAYAGAVMARNMAAPDAVEGIDAFLSKRAPCWSIS